MNVFKALFTKRKPEYNNDGIRRYTEKAIKMLGEYPMGIEYETMADLFRRSGMPQATADRLLIFLPITFVRCLIPDLKWSETYIELEKGVQTTKRYMDTDGYPEIMEATELYFSQRPVQDTILKIAGRSAEFNALNRFLKDGGKMEDAVFSDTVIEW